MKNGIEIRPNFLSRLCGGELSAKVVRAGTAFLSRLCGGELCICKR